MRRENLEHIIRAAADVTKERDFIIIGSQAILGQYPDAPATLLQSIEADIYPRDRPELAIDIESIPNDPRWVCTQRIAPHFWLDAAHPDIAVLVPRLGLDEPPADPDFRPPRVSCHLHRRSARPRVPGPGRGRPRRDAHPAPRLEQSGAAGAGGGRPADMMRPSRRVCPRQIGNLAPDKRHYQGRVSTPARGFP